MKTLALFAPGLWTIFSASSLYLAATHDSTNPIEPGCHLFGASVYGCIWKNFTVSSWSQPCAVRTWKSGHDFTELFVWRFGVEGGGGCCLAFFGLRPSWTLSPAQFILSVCLPFRLKVRTNTNTLTRANTHHAAEEAQQQVAPRPWSRVLAKSARFSREQHSFQLGPPSSNCVWAALPIRRRRCHQVSQQLGAFTAQSAVRLEDQRSYSRNSVFAVSSATASILHVHYGTPHHGRRFTFSFHPPLRCSFAPSRGALGHGAPCPHNLQLAQSQ